MDIINLNWIILFLIAIYILQAPQGFPDLGSKHGGNGRFVARGLPLFAPYVAGHCKGLFYQFLYYFTNGVDQLQASGNLAVTSLSQTQIGDIVTNAGLPFPFDQLVADNMTNHVFEAQGFHTVSEYFGHTITSVVVNIFSFLVIYLVARIVISLLVNAVNYASPLPRPAQVRFPCRRRGWRGARVLLACLRCSW